jgi:predicted ArsR family transcriptional regulator
MPELVHNHTATSLAAADSMKGSAALLRERIAVAIKYAGYAGLTRDEITDKTGIRPNTVRPRVLELLAEGRIARATFTRPTTSGRQAEVLVLQ